MLGARKRPQGTFDSDLELSAAVNYAVGAATTPGLDDGGAALAHNIGTGTFKGMAVIDISALVTGGGETYRLTVQGGDVAAFTNAKPLATLLVGAAAGYAELTANTTAGRHKVYFDNEVNGTMYPFIRLQITGVGGGADITLAAYVVPVQ